MYKLAFVVTIDPGINGAIAQSIGYAVRVKTDMGEQSIRKMENLTPTEYSLNYLNYI